MPNFQAITIADGKATPSNHTFQPIRNPAGQAEFAEPSATGSLTKRNTLQFLQKLPGKGRGTVSNELQLVLPYVVTETINGNAVESVRSNVRAIVQIVCDPDTPKSIRTDARVMIRNALANADIASAFDDVLSFN